MTAGKSSNVLTKYLFVLGLSLGVVGCAGHSDYTLPLEETEKFSQSGTAALQDYWWKELNDKALNDYVDNALENNYSLAAVWQRRQAAKALARREMADLFPALDLDGTVSERSGDGNTTDSYQLGPTASYEVDLWGKVRSNAQAERLRAQARLEEYKTAAITLSSDVALTWYRLVEAHDQLSLLKKQIEINNEVLDVLEARFGTGLVRSEDVLRQNLLIRSIEETIITQESTIETLEHQLAVLLGQQPQNADFKVKTKLPALPALPKTGLSSELLQRRPDIREAYYDLQATDRDLAVAVRDQYPSLTISASYTSNAERAADLFTDWVTTLGANLTQPLFDAGERKAEVRRSEAVRAQAINTYAQTVLEALQEVEDALIQEEKQYERIGNLKKRLKIADETYEQIQLGYLNGANEYIEVLTALNELQQIERDLITAKRNLIEFRIGLYRALAGGFETPREKTPDNKKTKDLE